MKSRFLSPRQDWVQIGWIVSHTFAMWLPVKLQWIEQQIYCDQWHVNWVNSVTPSPGWFSELGNLSVTYLWCNSQWNHTYYHPGNWVRIGQIVSCTFCEIALLVTRANWVVDLLCPVTCELGWFQSYIHQGWVCQSNICGVNANQIALLVTGWLTANWANYQSHIHGATASEIVHLLVADLLCSVVCELGKFSHTFARAI